MPEETEKRTYDTEGGAAVSAVLLGLLNEYPGLKEGEKVLFAGVPPDGGLGFYPGPGAMYVENVRDILGGIRQKCRYPFDVVYRAAPRSDAQRLRIKEFLDTMGAWLEGQPVTIDGIPYQMSGWPSLGSGERAVQSISITAPAHLDNAYQDKVEDWTFAAELIYKNEVEVNNPWLI